MLHTQKKLMKSLETQKPNDSTAKSKKSKLMENLRAKLLENIKEKLLENIKDKQLENMRVSGEMISSIFEES